VVDRVKPSAAPAEASQRIAVARDLDELARLVVEQACTIHRCEAALLLRQPDSDEAVCWASTPSALPGFTIPGLPAHIDESSPAGRAIRTAEPVSTTEPTAGSNGLAKPHTVIAVPLKAGGALLGAIQLSGNFLSVSDPTTVLALEALAEKYAAAIGHLQNQVADSRGPADQLAPQVRREPHAQLNLEKVYESTYRAACELIPCDVFFIVLYNEESKVGDFVYHAENGAVLPPDRVQLSEGLIDYVIHSRHGVVVADSEQEKRFKIRRRGGGPNQVHSVICVPMEYGDRIIGALSAQCYRPHAFTETNLKVLSTFADQAALTIRNARLFAESQRKVDQLAVLNDVTRIISSTIEIGRLLELTCDAVRRMLPADSYFVALLDEGEQSLSVEVMIDEGESFPPAVMPLGNTMASLVVRQRAPLLLKNVPEQLPQLGVEWFPLGKPKRSASWLGIPLITSEHLLGLIAMGSYQLAAFDEGDQEVLQNVAAQAAIAIDNARHHAEVERQAQHDSLTDALNHGYFLQRLHEEVARAEEAGALLSVIMLDIDHFKEYNDSFGHLSGDVILRGTVQAIRGNIKSGDLVGRWGGEEFVIALLGCDPPGARLVAERIRETLQKMKLENEKGTPVPVPTVSQGIATFPQDASAPIALVDVADVCLYRAKARGRDQISVAGE